MMFESPLAPIIDKMSTRLLVLTFITLNLHYTSEIHLTSQQMFAFLLSQDVSVSRCHGDVVQYEVKHGYLQTVMTAHINYSTLPKGFAL